MKIKHAPRFNTDEICAIYSEKDGVPVTYVCTTDLNVSDKPIDIFFRETPHPEFGNRYFGIFTQVGIMELAHDMMIVGADQVEDYDFGMIESSDGEWWYSQSHHDCLMIDGKMIDGGRQYTRGNGFEIFKIRDGRFVDLMDADMTDGIPLPGLIKPRNPESDDDFPDFVDNMDFS